MSRVNYGTKERFFGLPDMNPFIKNIVVAFLDASKQLFMRVCLPVGPFVRQSVRPPVRPCNAFV